jgi:hypothetical protein
MTGFEVGFRAGFDNKFETSLLTFAEFDDAFAATGTIGATTFFGILKGFNLGAAVVEEHCCCCFWQTMELSIELDSIVGCGEGGAG